MSPQKPRTRTRPSGPHRKGQDLQIQDDKAQSHNELDTVVHLFKALADATRLRIVGLVSEEPKCGQEIATELNLAPATVTHHLRLLRDAGLVTETRRPPYVDYQLDLGRLQRTVKSVLHRDKVQAFADPTDLTAETRRVLNAFFEGDQLTAIPAQRRKKEIVFEEILRRLPRQDSYGERELSDFIKQIHSDFCTIRREFVMGRYMSREGGVYHWTERGLSVVDRN